MRIQEHPILGEPQKGRLIEFTHDGNAMQGFEGEPIAVALRAAGVMAHRHTKKYDKPRGIFCAIGRCTDCVMVVNGKANVRTCITSLEEGMTVETQYGVSAKKPESISENKPENISEDLSESKIGNIPEKEGTV
ncbi:(2Fe-2S)-binding protein [[Clostridium] fimetarium]|uniref:2Fe-2S iron-sulfur cluster binding domain-containing protein n=1 Tax=[Clostridium] fimetarium TaxID=99656 RepID=A0A1I0NJ96_9FIRM|nr:(2Fe-2S)-binding protein [[Clostridium] fimetarium]SEW01240.1 2Fe-2S iron-sulfur cluster binding domain-containing protein [[Clostridium] fimetarium]